MKAFAAAEKRVKTCRGCSRPAQLLRLGQEGYPYRHDYGPTWTCVPCQAWVGCHPGTERPHGGLANAEHRAAKMAAHAAFDPLWKKKMARDACSKSSARRAGYRWLSEQLGIPFEKTHIGYMSLDECRKVVEVCNQAQPQGKPQPVERPPCRPCLSRRRPLSASDASTAPTRCANTPAPP